MDCYLLHEGKQCKWIFEDDSGEEDEKVYNDFVSFAEKKFSLKDVKIFKLKNKDNLTEKEGIDDDDELVNALVDGIDAGGAPLYFLIDGTAAKYEITVDLNACGGSDLLSMKISKHNMKDETVWNESWEDLCNDIGTELKDDEWENKYELFSSSQQQAITKLKQFIGAFKDAATSGDDVVSFYVAVMCCFSLSLFFIFFFFFAFGFAFCFLSSVACPLVELKILDRPSFFFVFYFLIDRNEVNQVALMHVIKTC